MPSEQLGPYAGPAIRMGTAVRWVFRAIVVFILVQLVLSAWVLGLIDTLESRSTFLKLAQIGKWSALLAIATVILLVLAAVLFLVWQYRAANAVAMQQVIDTPPISPGWHVGWWFIPFANLVMVPIALGQLLRASVGGPGRRWSDEPFPGIVLGWWLLFLAGRGLGRFSVRKMEDASTVRSIADALWLDIVAMALTLFAIVLILEIVKGICTAQAGWTAPEPVSSPDATPAT